MKATLEFDLYEDREAFEDAVTGTDSKVKLNDIWDKVFRPSFKHEYDKKIEEVIDACGTYIDQDGDTRYHAHDLIELLSKIYCEIVHDD